VSLPQYHSPGRRTLVAAAVVAALSAASLGSTPPAYAATPYWHLNSRSAPSNFPASPGQKAVITASVTNLGNAEVNGSKQQIRITDMLPKGVKATDVKANFGEKVLLTCSVETVSCTTSGSVLPYERLEFDVKVENEIGQAGDVANEVKVEGGELPGGGAMPGASRSRSFPVSAAATPFGLEKYEFAPENEDGSVDTIAGSHPFQLTTFLNFNQIVEGEEPAAPALAKTVRVNLPPGLLGDPNAVPKCSDAQFSQVNNNAENACLPETAIGVATTSLAHANPGLHGRLTFSVPVFNLVPAPGEPARFGFEAFKVPVIFSTSVRTGGDYGVVVSVRNITEETQILDSQVTLWGEPGSTVHDQSRGWGCGAVFGNLGCHPPEVHPPTPFLTMPTSCTGPTNTLLEAFSWAAGFAEGESELPALQGCEHVPFNPSIAVQPIAEAEGKTASPTTSANTPTGLRAEVELPQKETTLAEKGLGEADVRDSTFTLPAGIQLNPAAASGLLSCTKDQVGYLGEGSTNDPFSKGAPEPLKFTTGPAQCPDASKVGVVHISTPLLANELVGGVYLAKQEENPFGSVFALYIVAEDEASGIRVKLAGKVSPDPTTGQLTTTFTSTPQTPFETLRLEFFGGSHASITTPPLCGGYSASSSFTPWSSPAPKMPPSAPFQITSGPGGGPCPSSFDPGFGVGSANLQAGAYTNFTVNISKPDADQVMTSLSMRLPTGLAGTLKNVTLCKEADANAGTCPVGSLIGHATASAGLGPEPFTQTGNVYITEKYNGAPFGLSIVTPTKAGPFDFGNLIVRSTINIDRSTAALTISNPLPTMINTATHQTGVPTQIKQITVTVDRPNFQFNPTNCTPTHIDATFSGARGATSTKSVPFQVANCSSLPFKPTFEASTEGKASKGEGASLKVKVTSGPGQANIGKTDLTLPIALPSRLSTIQKACAAAAFEANPASCPEGSNIGTATVHTPVLNNPLTGPAYLVSHGAAKFPDVEFVLQGEGITLVLDGETDIKKGITYSRFETLPDAPVSVFETILPRGPHSALTSNVAPSANFNLCGTNLVMPTVITGQNGTVIKQNTNIKVLGCPPSVKITKIRVKGNALLVTVNLSATGTAKIGGKGLKTTVKRGLKAGSHTITVPLTNAGKTAKRGHKKIKVKATLTVGRQSAIGTASVKA
jgi:hypothetical protein